MEKKITGRGEYMHSMDCTIQQVQCECGEIFEDWTVKDAEAKFEKHQCQQIDAKTIKK